MKRKGLKFQLALAINHEIGFTHALTLLNAKRYVTQEVRTLFRIRKETTIDEEDWLLALQAVREDRVGHFLRVANDDRTPAEDRFMPIIDSIQREFFRSLPQKKVVSSPYV